jgi:hypothetical protein
MLPTPPLPVGK